MRNARQETRKWLLQSKGASGESALRGRIHRLGLTPLASALVIAAGPATAQSRDEAAIRALGDSFARAFVQKNPEARLVPTYTPSQITPLRNNYNGATPDPGYIPEWRLTIDGLTSGLSVSLNIRNLLASFQLHEQITRLVCVEGWSAIALWAGLRFDDLLGAYPPLTQAKWVRIESSVNLGPWGNPDPYYVSLDLLTARHPQTLLATHLNGKPLTVEHGAPMRLLVPVKLGLKNIKAITRITYTRDEPADYWAKRGYSRYDGI